MFSSELDRDRELMKGEVDTSVRTSGNNRSRLEETDGSLSEFIQRILGGMDEEYLSELRESFYFHNLPFKVTENVFSLISCGSN